MKNNNNTAIVGLVGFLLGAAVFWYIGYSSRTKTPDVKEQQIVTDTPRPVISPTPKSTSTPVPSPTDIPNDTTKDWLTFTSGVLVFKYPPELTPQERQKGYVVLLTDAKNPQSVLVSADGRKSEELYDYNIAVDNTKASLVDAKTETITNGVKITGKIGPGYAQGQPVTKAVLNYNGAAVTFETPATSAAELKTFDLIVSTFIFPAK